MKHLEDLDTCPGAGSEENIKRAYLELNSVVFGSADPLKLIEKEHVFSRIFIQRLGDGTIEEIYRCLLCRVEAAINED